MLHIEGSAGWLVMGEKGSYEIENLNINLATRRADKMLREWPFNEKVKSKRVK